eukprot:scaffold7720_cov129-Isochrysis_galbana.AAC.4
MLRVGPRLAFTCAAARGIRFVREMGAHDLWSEQSDRQKAWPSGRARTDRGPRHSLLDSAFARSSCRVLNA